MEHLMLPLWEERKRAEQELLTQIQAASEVYLTAAEEYARITGDYHEALDNSDESLALHEAATNEANAFEKYSELLETLTQLILRGSPVSADATES